MRLVELVVPWKKVGGLTLRVDPLRVEIRERRLVADVLGGFEWLVVDDAAGPPSSSTLARTHLVFRPGMFWGKLGVGMEGEGGSKGEGRQFGGIDRSSERSGRVRFVSECL